MNGLRAPLPRDPFDLSCAVSLARQALAAGDGVAALNALKLLLRDLDALHARDPGPLPFDRMLVADALQHPHKYRSDVLGLQAMGVRAALGPDTPMTNPRLAGLRIFRSDED